MNDFVPIQISRKLSIEAHAAGRFAHSFGLNSEPSAGWRTLVLQDVDGCPRAEDGKLFDVSFAGDVLVLICAPEDLPARYAYLKAAVGRANSAHGVARRGFDDLKL